MDAIAGNKEFELLKNAISARSSYFDLSPEDAQALKYLPPLAIALMMILRPPYPPRSEAEGAITRWVGAEVLRKLLYPQFSDYKLPRVQKKTKGFHASIKAEVELWIAVWEMLKSMGYEHDVLWDHPASLFYKIVMERELVSPWVAPPPTQENFKGASHWHKEYQPGINTDLALGSDNPENPFIQPITREVIDKAFYLVNLSIGFEKNFYRPLVSKRKFLVARLREDAPTAYINGKPLLKGSHNHPVGFEKNKKKAK